MTKIDKDVRAVKIMVKDNMSKEEHLDFAYETAILKKLDHPNILKLYEVFEDKQKY
jgi:serine/threonine protein kinase